MTPEERELQTIQLLHKIDKKLEKLDALEEIANLLRISQASLIQKTKETVLEKSPLQKAIYELCDGKHTVSEITETLGSKISSISQAISRLQKAGLIAEERRGKQKYYKQLI